MVEKVKFQSRTIKRSCMVVLEDCRSQRVDWEQTDGHWVARGCVIHFDSSTPTLSIPGSGYNWPINEGDIDRVFEYASGIVTLYAPY